MKRLLTAALFITAAHFAKAQQFSIGPSIGFGHTWLSENINFVAPTLPSGTTTIEGDKQFKASYNAGVSMAYSTKESWGFGMDIKYSREGGQYQYKYNNTDYELTLSHSYLRIPLRATYYFKDLGDGIRPKISAGPSFGFLLDGDSKFEGDGIAPEDEETDTKDDLKSFDFGVNAGIGCNFRIAPNVWLNTDIVYTHGFTQVNKNDVGGTGVGLQPTGDFKNRNIGLNVGVLFGLGGSSATTATTTTKM